MRKALILIGGFVSHLSSRHMAQLPPHLEVKESLIAGAGMGLFVKRPMRMGQKIGRYRGVIYKRKDSHTVPDSHKPYLIEGIENEVIDGYRLDNHMRWANHSTTPNAFAILYSDGVILFRAIRYIEAGEEIYIDYGYDPTVPDPDEEAPPNPFGALKVQYDEYKRKLVSIKRKKEEGPFPTTSAGTAFCGNCLMSFRYEAGWLGEKKCTECQVDWKRTEEITSPSPEMLPYCCINCRFAGAYICGNSCWKEKE